MVERSNSWYEPDETKEFDVEFHVSKVEVIGVCANSYEEALEIAKGELSSDYEVIDSSVRRVG